MPWGRLGCWASDEDSTTWAWTDATRRAPPRMAGSGGHFSETAVLLKDAPGSRKQGSQIFEAGVGSSWSMVPGPCRTA